MQVKINLNKTSREDTVNVELQWNVAVTEPKAGSLPKLFRKYIRVNRPLRLNVTNIEVPEEIECDKEKLFSILYDTAITPQSKFPVDITVKNMATPFQLLFNQGEIRDCLRPQNTNPRVYAITFDVELLDAKKDVIIDSYKEQIDVIFEPLNVKPAFKIDIDELNDEVIQYSSSLRRECVGSFLTWINEDFQFTPDQLADVTVKLYKGDEDVSEFVSFDDGTKEKKLTINRGRGNIIKTPIYVDFTDIPNPIDEEEVYTIQTSIVQSAAYSPEIKETIIQQQQFTLLKDLQGTELKVFLQRTDCDPILCDDRHLPSIPLNFVPRSRLMGQAKVILSNIATDNSNKKAGLYIKNLTLTETLLGDVSIIGDNDTIPSQFTYIDGPEIDDLRSDNGLFIPNGPNASTEIAISFDPSKIVDLYNSDDYKFSVQSVLTFDYYEDREGKGIGDVKQKSVSITWNLHLEPNPEWLCVDYGSSAIVCVYGNTILNLRQQKEKIFKNESEGKFSVDTYERGTPFLSSDVVLHRVRNATHSTLCSQLKHDENVPYLELSVCLSPTSSLMKEDVNTQVPCLKILVGNEYLPDKPAYNVFQYARIDKNNDLYNIQASAAKRMEEQNCILRISTIFSEAYETLFRHFILPVSRDKSINKLVLTHPNTYTPAHLKVLEKIVQQTFPKIREGYLRFVSESDAVAAYYVSNWDRYNGGMNISDNETVLVYDMGAGTLDITLFRKSQNSEGKIDVEILGKIGSGKAGNYLDYIICEIINDKMPSAVKTKMVVSTKNALDPETLTGRLDLKDLVKNDIKPNLEMDKNLHFGGSTLSSNEILTDKRFKGFLKEVTSGIIKQLMSFTNSDIKGIDTVLMSGRSCRLEAISNALKSTVPKARIVKFDKDNDKDNDKEKTVVAEGAMIRAGIFSAKDTPVIIRSRRLYASYGLIYKELGGNFHYEELLDGSSLPLVEDNGKLGDYDGVEKCISVRNDNVITLIQTYLSPQDTEIAYNKGDTEFISLMEEYNMGNFGGENNLNVRLRLDFKNNVSLYVNGMLSKGSTPRGVDLNSEITKRSIWPVTIE